MAERIEDIRGILGDIRTELMSKPNVVATGIGYKISGGRRTDELSIICSVEVKKSKKMLLQSELVPSSIQNISTDIIPSGPFTIHQSRTSRFRPAPGGVSIGHINITAGTLGCLVKKNNEIYILSNNHVLANSNDASVGDPILQPGPYDGGQYPGDGIAQLSEFIPITFDGSGGGGSQCPTAKAVAAILNGTASLVGSNTRIKPYKIKAVKNKVDCAIAKPIESPDVDNTILGFGSIAGVRDGTLGMNIKKSGRTTEITAGTIQQIDVTAQVTYGTNKTATFTDQLMAGGMSQGGDSGSAVLDDQNYIVGLLFAGSTNSTIINRIQNVFDALNVQLA